MKRGLPAKAAETQAMIEETTAWVGKVSAMLTAESARSTLRHHLKLYVAEGTLPIMQAVEAARAEHEDADRALRELAVEMLDRGEMPGAALRAYVQEALLRSPMTYPPGRNLIDTWMRDIGVAVLVRLAADRWNLPPTRNRASTRPSACSVVSEALGRNSVNIAERRVEGIFAGRGGLAEKLSASIPDI